MFRTTRIVLFINVIVFTSLSSLAMFYLCRRGNISRHPFHPCITRSGVKLYNSVVSTRYWQIKKREREREKITAVGFSPKELKYITKQPKNIHRELPAATGGVTDVWLGFLVLFLHCNESIFFLFLSKTLFGVTNFKSASFLERFLQRYFTASRLSSESPVNLFDDLLQLRWFSLFKLSHEMWNLSEKSNSSSLNKQVIHKSNADKKGHLAKVYSTTWSIIRRQARQS